MYKERKKYMVSTVNSRALSGTNMSHLEAHCALVASYKYFRIYQ